MGDLFRDASYLARHQYADASNLNARIELHARFSTNPRGWTQWAFDQFDLPEPARILEVGGGAGRLWSANAGRLPAEWHVMLTDLSVGMLEGARRGLASHAEQFRLAAADVRTLPFPDRSFDAVMAHFMLYHVTDVPKALCEIRRVLRPGGRLYAATNGRGHLHELREWTARFFGDSVPFAPEDSRFNLDVGGAVLAAYFEEVQAVRHNDSLFITEVEPVLTYIQSTPGHETVPPDALVACRKFLEALRAKDGGISIGKNAGMFIARRAND